MLYINVAWQGMVVGAIYSTQGPSSNDGIIVWAAVVGYIASLPVPFFLGWQVFSRLYSTSLQKYAVRHAMKTNIDKANYDQQ
jgi:hypothetical protein